MEATRVSEDMEGLHHLGDGLCKGLEADCFRTQLPEAALLLPRGAVDKGSLPEYGLFEHLSSFEALAYAGLFLDDLSPPCLPR